MMSELNELIDRNDATDFVQKQQAIIFDGTVWNKCYELNEAIAIMHLLMLSKHQNGNISWKQGNTLSKHN